MNLERPKLLNSESSRTICDKLCHIASLIPNNQFCRSQKFSKLWWQRPGTSAVSQLGVDNSLSVCNCPLPDKQQTSLEPFCITFRDNCENVNIPNSSLLRARLAILRSWPLYWLSAEDQDLWTSSLCFLLKSWGTCLSQLEQIEHHSNKT